MNKKAFKAAFSKYRAILSGQMLDRFTTHGNINLNDLFVANFNEFFGVNADRVAFVNNGCNYSFTFEWVYGIKGSTAKQRIIERNLKVLN